MTIFKSCRNSASVACTFYAIILTWKFDPFDLTLTWFPSIVNFDDVIGSKFKNYQYQYLVVKDPQNMCLERYACDYYFQVTFCGLTLTFSGTTFALTQYHSQIFTSTLCEFELFSVRLTESTVQNVKTASFLLLTWYSPYTWHLS